MIAFLGDVHDLLGPMWDRLRRTPAEVTTIIQLGDLWVWPEEADVPPMPDGSPRPIPKRPRDPSLHWQHPPRELHFIDGNHHNYWLTRELREATQVAPGLTFLPRGTVMLLEGRRKPLRVGVLGGADSVLDAPWRRLGDDWWPEEERVSEDDVERLLANARAAGGLDILVTHTPPASVTTAMTNGGTPHPSSILVETAWRELGGGGEHPSLELIAGHMHESWTDPIRRVQVLPMLGVTVR